MTSKGSQRRTVLVLASTYPRWRDDHEPGFVHELCRRLVDRFDVVAVVPDAQGADPSGTLDGVCVVRYRYAPRAWQTLVNNGGIAANLKRQPWKWLLVPGFIVGLWWAARRVLRSQQVDAIHAHWLIPQGFIAQLLARFAGVPYVVTSHGGDLFGFRGKALESVKRTVAANSSGMTVVSTAMAEEVARLDMHPPQLAVVPMGVDLRNRFVPGNDVVRKPDSLLFVGRLVAKKGLCHLLDAMPAILSRRPSVELIIAGFGPEEEALRAQAQRLRIASHVRFLGATPQGALPALYRGASLFVAPFVRDASGDQEGLPVVLMEAMGCGCPVVVGDVAGLHDLLGDAASEVCVDAKDTAQLADRVLQALDQPDASRQRALALREKALHVIDWQGVSGRYGDLLEQCMAQHDGRR
ncbi:glycosyltransferase [Dyella sp. C11]|uniref:glycosyltransferase n=1 Tax=Dyella sp. C11 TaxID=2126991 RepID=UPI000D64D79C|nr:glycosyltransferase [Dyella sp. C11]